MDTWKKVQQHLVEHASGAAAFESNDAIQEMAQAMNQAADLASVFMTPLQHRMMGFDGALTWLALCDAFARRNPAAPPCRTWNLGTAMGALQNTYSRAVAELIELDDEDGEE